MPPIEESRNQAVHKCNVSFGATPLLCKFLIPILEQIFFNASSDVRDERQEKIRNPNDKGGT